jgi:AraC-like DNA-binding protein
MDAWTGLLDGARSRGALFKKMLLEPPWSLRIADGAPLALATMLRGHAWIVPDDEPARFVGPGDVAVIRGTAPYTVADDPATAPEIVIHSGNRPTSVDGVDLTEALRLGVRTCGLHPNGSGLVVSGTYPTRGDVSGRLLTALPRVLVVPRDEIRSPVLDLVDVEVNRDEPGQQMVLNRLLDLLLIATLRAWFARPGTEVPGWYRAQGDPVVGPALQLIHDDPAHSWSVAELAQKVGVSRAVFARRFTALVGEPPMRYLTSWRLDVAADLVRETDATLEAIARKTGYANAFAFSAAFKRRRGTSPSDHRSGRDLPEEARP